jgi:methyl-accepting chemotaxis protein
MTEFLMNLNIGKRLLAGFAAVLLVAIVAIGIGDQQLHAVADASKTLLEEPLTKERLVSDWYRVIYSGIGRSLAIVKNNDSSLANYFTDATTRGTSEAAALQKRIEPLINSDKEKILWADLQRLRKDYLELRNQAIALKKEGKMAEADILVDQKFAPAAKLFAERIQDLQNEERTQIDNMAAEIQDRYHSSRKLMTVLTVLMVMFVVVGAWIVSRSITNPLGSAVEVARRVAAGDLTVRIDSKSNDETGQLLAALRDMTGNLATLVAGVRNSTVSMTVAAKEIASGNIDLSRRTELQASSLEETSSSMEQLTSTVKQNADNAQQANKLVILASGIAVEGGAVVGEVVSTMNGIKDSSDKIFEIIGVIDAIAFQTNILALNAAVEAARAGDQGRGFAVVASEVRNLAQRSAIAAKEIKDLIGASVDQIENGAKLVDQAGKTMEKIVGSVQQVANIMSEITIASREQSAGIEQVNIAVVQMDQMTQENAALVEEAAAAAQSMEIQASELSQAVSVFVLDTPKSGQSRRMVRSALTS